jgi:hypothetical protein
MRLATSLAALCGLLTLPLLADFSYQQTSRISGGSITRVMKLVPGGGKALAPQTTTHLLQGNRMATVGASTIDIIDVDRQLMTHINLDNRTYSTITFAEFRQAMDNMLRKMGQAPKEGQPNMQFRIDVKDTGETKTIDGMHAKLMKMLLATDIKDQKSGQTATMNMDMDMWMANDIPGYDEVRKFQMKYAETIGITPEILRVGRMAAGQPGMSEGMAKLMKEASKLQGVPLVQVTRMMGTGGLGGPGGDAPEAQAPTGKDVGDAAATSAVSSALGRVSGLGGLGGRLGGFGRKKKEEPKEEPKPAPAPANAPPAASGQPQQSVFMELTSEMSAFSTAPVDGSKFSVPAGFKEVEHDMKKALK